MLQNRRSGVPHKLGSSLAAGAIWCAAALSAAYWVLRWPDPSVPALVPVAAATRISGVPSTAPLARALGAHNAALSPVFSADGYQLLGVIADASGMGRALISVDGQAAKPYQRGQAVGEGWVLQSVGPKSAQLGASMSGPVLRELSLPANKTP